jgi:1-acyl-sn-glycerol-3-phosphate acyltransferase
MNDVGFGSRFLALSRAVVGFGSVMPYTLAQWVLERSRSRWRKPFKRWYYRNVCRVLGLSVTLRGKPAPAPVLFVSNHISYFDILVLGSVLDACFVSRSDVRNWPLVGWSAGVQGTVFIERRRGEAKNHTDTIGERLAADDSLVVFAEGTSGDGNHVLPFKSTLFAVAERRPHGQPLTVQPVTLAYTKLDGVPMGRYLRPLFAWYGDMTLTMHVLRALSLGKVTVDIILHEPVTIDGFAGRKALSDHCRAQISRGLSEALSGRRAIKGAGAGLASAA